MNGKCRIIAMPGSRFPGRDWLVGWIILSLTFCPTFPGGQVPSLQLSQMAQASGEYGGGEYGGGEYGDGDGESYDSEYGGGENYDETMGDPGMGDPGNSEPGYDDYSQDSDGDGWPDEDESNVGTDPHNPASYPGAVDPAEMDSDGDGLNDSQENSGFEIEVEVWVEDDLGYYNEETGTVGFWMPFTEWVYPDPAKADTDGDLLPDGWEVSTPGFNPTSPADGLADPDLDGLGTGEEYLLGTAWQNPDSDGDGFLDGVEVLELGTDPTDADDPLPAEEPADDSGDSDVDGGMGGGGDSGGTGTGEETTGDGETGGGDGTQGGDGDSTTHPPMPDGGGVDSALEPEYTLEVKGATFSWEVRAGGGGSPDGMNCRILSETTEYVVIDEWGNYEEMELVTCTCDSEFHPLDAHSHDFDGDDRPGEEEDDIRGFGVVAALNGGQRVDHDEYAKVMADYRKRYQGLADSPEAPLPLPSSLGTALGAWHATGDKTPAASAMVWAGGLGVSASGGMRIVRLKADVAADRDVERSYLLVSQRREEHSSEPYEVMRVETVRLHIRAGETISENAAVLIPKVEMDYVNQVTLIPVEIVPDYNRDGRIDDKDRGKVTKDNPWRWWVNDDDDSGEYGASADRPDVPEGATIGQYDYQDDEVDGIRDLVDFFPLHLDLQQIIEVFPSSEYQYFLRQKSSVKASSLGAVWYPSAHLDKEPGELYSVGGFLRNLDQAADVAARPVEEVTSAGVQIPQIMLDVSAKGRGMVLLEGKFINHEPLMVEIRDNGGASVAEIEFPLKIAKVEEMYRHVDLRTVPLNPDGSDAGNVPSPLGTKTDDPGYSYPDKLTNGKYFVFVHGYNVNEEKARGWFAEIFKRLHQMGSRARFVGVSWRGDAGLGGIDNPSNSNTFLELNINYHKPVFFALQTGDALREALNFTGKADMTIAAHSLGNMVVSHAIAQKNGLSPNRYYMIDAAVAAEAYDSASTQTQRYHMLEKDWKPQLEVYGGSLKATSARWYELFDDTDHRSDLKWVDRFAKVTQKAYHFYSTGEEVLQNPAPKMDTAALFESGLPGAIELSKGRRSWVAQEFSKGTFYLASASQDFDGLGLGTRQAGWGFDDQYIELQSKIELVLGKPMVVTSKVNVPPSPEEVAALSGDELRYNPIFRDFMVENLTDPSLGSVVAKQKLVKYHVLASGIPALSYAAGSNPIGGEDMKNRRFNMPDLFQTPGGQWPAEGHSGLSKKNWLHSDFYGVALSHVYLMYEKMIEIGKLDDENKD